MNKILKNIIILTVIIIFPLNGLFISKATDVPKSDISGTQVVAPGEEITITVNVKGNDIAAAQMDVYIEDRFFEIMNISDVNNDNWTIEHFVTDKISIVAYCNDLSSLTDISLLQITLKAKDYIIKGDKTSINIKNCKVISREFSNTLSLADSEYSIYVGEFAQARDWSSQKATIDTSNNSSIDLYMYEYPQVPNWVLLAAINNNISINVHMVGYDYKIDPNNLDEENIKDDFYAMSLHVDYDGHKYTDNQIALIDITDSDNYPGMVQYSIYMPESDAGDTLMLYRVDESSKYELLGEYLVNEDKNIIVNISDFGKYIVSKAEITGDLLAPYKKQEMPEDVQVNENLGTEIITVVIIFIIIALFWLAAVLFFRAVRKRIYRKKINARTMELLLDEDKDEMYYLDLPHDENTDDNNDVVVSDDNETINDEE